MVTTDSEIQTGCSCSSGPDQTTQKVADRDVCKATGHGIMGNELS